MKVPCIGRRLALLMCLTVAACGQPESGTTTAHSSVSPTASAAGAPARASTSIAETGSAESTTTASHGAAVMDQVSLVDQLRSMGYTVDDVGDVEQPFFQTSGTTMRVSGGALQEPVDLQVFNYDDAGATEADAQQIGPDGNPLTMMITWVAPPHFFRKDKVIVLYLGSDQEAITLLTQALGSQFAGT